MHAKTCRHDGCLTAERSPSSYLSVDLGITAMGIFLSVATERTTAGTATLQALLSARPSLTFSSGSVFVSAPLPQGGLRVYSCYKPLHTAVYRNASTPDRHWGGRSGFGWVLCCHAELFCRRLWWAVSLFVIRFPREGRLRDCGIAGAGGGPKSGEGCTGLDLDRLISSVVGPLFGQPRSTPLEAAPSFS